MVQHGAQAWRTRARGLPAQPWEASCVTVRIPSLFTYLQVENAVLYWENEVGRGNNGVNR